MRRRHDCINSSGALGLVLRVEARRDRRRVISQSYFFTTSLPFSIFSKISEGHSEENALWYWCLNILLDRDLLKLSDFDCTAEIGSDFEACTAPYGRILNGNEAEGRRGGSGFLGPRTEQFALGSLYYLINYGCEVYGDCCLTEDPKEHGPEVVDLLQNMKFPELDGDPIIDNIIESCWYNKYTTVRQLASHTESLLIEGTNSEDFDAEANGWGGVMGRKVRGLWCGLVHWWSTMEQSASDEAANTAAHSRGLNGDNCDGVGQDHLAEDLFLKKTLCQDLKQRGLLQLLTSGEPEQLGFIFKWYRYMAPGVGRSQS